MNPVQLAARQRHFARLLRTDGETHGVECFPQFLQGDIHADVRSCLENDALLLQLIDTSRDLVLGKFEIGNAVHHQSADFVVALEHSHLMSYAIELLGGSQPSRAAADDGDAPAGAFRRRLGHDPAFSPATIDDRPLDALDCDRFGVDCEHARRLARRGARVSGELGEIVGRVQTVERRVPVPARDEIVPIRNDVANRTAGHACRHAAIHAARPLLSQMRLFPARFPNFSIIADTLARVAFANRPARDFQIAVWMIVSHWLEPASLSSRFPLFRGRRRHEAHVFSFGEVARENLGVCVRDNFHKFRSALVPARENPARL
jgi:hypothetical protein